jgi:hypothetical protein
MLRRSPELAIIQCEEFSIRLVCGKALSPLDEMLLPNLSGFAGLGLCGNCINAITCGFPEARKGVLQCEEYRLDDAGATPPRQVEYSESAA